MRSLRQRASRLSEKLEVPVDEHLDGARPTAWNNRDLAPLPPSRRTWTVWGFMGFWAVIQLNTVGWQTASSLISLGLSVWEAMIVTIIAKVSCPSHRHPLPRAQHEADNQPSFASLQWPSRTAGGVLFGTLASP